MEHQKYESIIQCLQTYSWADLDTVESGLCDQFPDVPPLTLRSILCLQYQRHIKTTFHSEHSDHNKALTYARVMEAVEDEEEEVGEVVRLTRESGFSPALTARMVLHSHQGGDKVNIMMKDTTLIENGRLALEVMMANIKDDSYGHVAESIKHSIGEEHEQKLKDILTQRNIPFTDEHVLRSLGYDKTPDIKLEVPISVDGCIINWIESKALFGDPESHHGYLRDQLWSYLNRLWWIF